MVRLAMLTVALALATAAAAAPSVAGTWESARFTLELRAQGTNVHGTFTDRDAQPPVSGTVGGTLSPSGTLLLLTWKWSVGENTFTRGCGLVVSSHGRTLDGSMWTGFEGELPILLCLRRGIVGKPGVFLDAETLPAIDTRPPAAPPTAVTTPAPPAAVVTLYDNSNTAGVTSRPTKPTVFTLAKPAKLTYLRTYHYNSGAGAKPGTLALTSGGKTYGPWPATGTGATGGRLPIMWVVEPMVELPAGTYTVVDSDPATWSHNAQTGGAGITWVSGSPHD